MWYGVTEVATVALPLVSVGLRWFVAHVPVSVPSPSSLLDCWEICGVLEPRTAPLFYGIRSSLFKTEKRASRSKEKRSHKYKNRLYSPVRLPIRRPGLTAADNQSAASSGRYSVATVNHLPIFTPGVGFLWLDAASSELHPLCCALALPPNPHLQCRE